MSSIMLKEIQEIPEALERLADYYSSDQGSVQLKHLQTCLNDKETRHVMFVGMGTSLFASMLGTYKLHEAGILANSYEAGELLHFQHPIVSSNDMIFLISQSGKSVELLKLAESLKGSATLAAMTENIDGPMAKACDIILPMMAGQEDGPATKTYVNTLALSYLTASTLAGNDIQTTVALLREVAAMQRTLLDQREEIVSSVIDFLPDPNFINLIARGSSVSSTHAGALILKETSKLFTEPITSAAFRHGPIETVRTPGHAAFVFATEERTRCININLAEEMASLGSKVILITSEDGPSQGNLLRVVLPDAPQGLSPLLEIMPLEFVSMEYAVRRGHPIGEFVVGGKVTEVE